MTTTNPGRAGDPTAQVPEGLRSAIHHAIYESLDCLTFQQARTIRDAVLAALFAACEVREAFCTRYTDRYHGSSDYPAVSAEEALAAAKRAMDYVDATAMRWLVIETEPEPVSSTGEEPTDAP